LFLEPDKPLIFGENNDKGIKLDGFKPVVVQLDGDNRPDDLWIHDESDINKAQLLTRMFHYKSEPGHLPRPFGVFYQEIRPTYEESLNDQVAWAISESGEVDLDKLIEGKETWTINGV